MARFTATGSLRLSGVIFMIDADTEEEAKKKAEAGKFDEYEIEVAEAVDWSISPNTVRADE